MFNTLIENTASTLHVVMIDADQSPITGVTPSDVVVYTLKNGGAPVLKSVVGAWTEVGASFPGVYAINLSSGELDTLGTFLVSIRPDPGTVIVGMPELIVVNVAVIEDIQGRVGTLQGDVTTLAGSVDGVQASVDGVQVSVDAMLTEVLEAIEGVLTASTADPYKTISNILRDGTGKVTQSTTYLWRSEEVAVYPYWQDKVVVANSTYESGLITAYGIGDSDAWRAVRSNDAMDYGMNQVNCRVTFPGESYYAVPALRDRTLYAVDAASHNLYVSTDAGLTWTVDDAGAINSQDRLNAVRVSPDGNVVAVAGGQSNRVLRIKVGTDPWINADGPFQSTANLRDIVVANAENVWAVGTHGHVLYYYGATYPTASTTIAGGIAINGLFPIYQNENGYGNPDTGVIHLYALRADGKVYISKNRGVNWTEVVGSPANGLSKGAVYSYDGAIDSAIGDGYDITYANCKVFVFGWTNPGGLSKLWEVTISHTAGDAVPVLSWTDITSRLPGFVANADYGAGLFVDRGLGKVIFTTAYSVFESDDGGATFSRTLDLPPYSYSFSNSVGHVVVGYTDTPVPLHSIFYSDYVGNDYPHIWRYGR